MLWCQQQYHSIAVLKWHDMVDRLMEQSRDIRDTIVEALRCQSQRRTCLIYMMVQKVLVSWWLMACLYMYQTASGIYCALICLVSRAIFLV